MYSQTFRMNNVLEVECISSYPLEQIENYFTTGGYNWTKQYQYAYSDSEYTYYIEYEVGSSRDEMDREMLKLLDSGYVSRVDFVEYELMG